MRYAFVLDQSRCIGCHACSLACKAEHDVPLGSYRTWVKYVEKGSFPDVRRFFSVLRCNHCDDAPCVEICPVTALFRRDDGIVDFDRDVCIGCKACMQACPYDALYIHPQRGTAEKCNFCAHRVEIDLEPPCATVCPAEAIIVGDLDNPASRLAQIVSSRQVSVRKPEKGTRPKVFYVQGEPRALTPGAADPSGGFLWADRPPGVQRPETAYLEVGLPTATSTAGGESSMGGEPSVVVGPSAPAEPPAGAGGEPWARGESSPSVGAGRAPGPDADAGRSAVGTPPAAWLSGDLPPAAAAQALASAAARGEADFFTGAWAGLAPARTVYDVRHGDPPWGWKVSAYLWTKSVAAGAFVVAALAGQLGLIGNDAVIVGAPLLGLVFLALTGALLVADLKRPERFWTILTRPNWGSWLARGAFILAVFGALATTWTALGVATWASVVPPMPTARDLLRWPLVAAAVAAAGYSGYLFAQARGRDFWQSPLLPFHFAVQAVAAGAAAVALVAALASSNDSAIRSLGSLLAGALALHIGLVVCGELTVAHATRDAHVAARAMTRGRYAAWFWASMLLTGLPIAVVMVAGLGSGGLGAGVAALALFGLAAYEHAWNLAGQAPPLS